MRKSVLGATVVATAFTLALAACGSDGLSIDANSSNFCGQIAEVACHNLYQCCTEGEIEGYLNVSDPRTQAPFMDDDANMDPGWTRTDARRTASQSRNARRGGCAHHDAPDPRPPFLADGGDDRDERDHRQVETGDDLGLGPERLVLEFAPSEDH